jgi:hypothetical protein
MATKRAAKKSVKKAAKKGARKKNVMQRARQEIRELLKQEQAGTLTRRELEAGLKEIEKYLEVMDVFIHSSL